MIELNKIFPSEFEISLSVKSYDKKICRYFYDTKNHLIFKLSQTSIPNFTIIIIRLVLKFCLNFTSLSLKLSDTYAVKER